MQNETERGLLQRLVAAPRFEILPTRAIAEEVMRVVPPGRTLTVTASMRLGLEATLTVTETLRAAGYDVVPHLAARMVPGRAELSAIVARLNTAGVTSVFVPAGDATPPLGPYSSSLDLLRELPEVGGDFSDIGIAGYPESHPTIADELLIQAMWDKRHLATAVVSNLCLDPAVVAEWVTEIRARGITLPVYVGMPGNVERTKLLTMATKIGVGASTKFLAKNPRVFAKIAGPGGFGPERFLEDLAASLSSEGVGVRGLHMYTFNQVEATEQWRAELAARLAAE